jgi:ABC-type multidrug transport system fused ATPase/permease subunit
VALGVPGPTIVVVLLLVARLARNVQSLATTGQLLANALPAVRDIEDLTTAAGAAAEHDGAETVIDLTDPFGAGPIVEFRDVSFHYAQGGNGVDHLDLVLPTGRATVITGPSGAGKSTTADLVLGLLRPDSGEILVGGSPLTPDRLRAWRSRVSYVPQETLLVPSSLRANLVWSVGRDVSDEECWDALHRAAASFARALPDGLDTRLGDRGIRLSGGERQRVAIARALLRRPALMVLDEATSSLDELTEAAVLDLVRSLTGSVTLLLIAHRRSTIEMADRVVRLDGGRRVPDANAGVP